MTVHPGWVWWSISASAALLAGLLVVAVLTRAGDTGVPASAAPPVEVVDDQEPEDPEPEDDEPDPPEPVRGEVVDVEVGDLSASGSGLRAEGSPADQPVAIDSDAVDAVVDAVASWLDDHLTSAQDGEGGHLPETLDGPRDAATTGLAHPDRPVVAATYRMTVSALGVPEWVAAIVAVDRADGSTGGATFVFAPTGDDLEVLAVLPADGTDVPAGTEESA